MTIIYLDEEKPEEKTRGHITYLDELPETAGGELPKEPDINDYLEKGPISALHEYFHNQPEGTGLLARAGRTLSTGSMALSKETRKLLMDQINKIPDPQRQSVMQNIVLNTPKLAAELGTDFISSSLTPVGLATAAFPTTEAVGAMNKKFTEKMPALSQALSGVRKKYFSRLMQDKKIILPEILGGPKNLEKAGQEVEQAEQILFGNKIKPSRMEVNMSDAMQAGEPARKTMEQIDDIRNLTDAEYKKIYKTDKPNLNDPDIGVKLIKAKRSTQFQLDQPSTVGSRRHFLTEQMNEINDLLSENFPQIREALKEYGRASTHEMVTKLLPVLRNGNPSWARMAGALFGAGHGVPPTVEMPITQGIMTVLGKLSLDALQKISETAPEGVRTLIRTELMRRQSENAR